MDAKKANISKLHYCDGTFTKRFVTVSGIRIFVVFSFMRGGGTVLEQSLIG